MNDDYYLNRDGLVVFTEAYLRKRGYCCGNGCRHCPYPPEQIPLRDRYDRHAPADSMPRTVVSSAITQIGLNPQKSFIQPLPGGYRNTNLLVQENDKRYVFRIYAHDREQALREMDLLRFLTGSSIPAPKPQGLLEIDGHLIGVIDYIIGITLENKLLSGNQIEPRAFENLGRHLALIHQLHLPNVGKGYESFARTGREWIENSLTDLQGHEDRLDREAIERIRNLIAEEWHLVEETESSGFAHQLVHGDFNPKNVLVSPDSGTELLAIIDWEFAVSAHGLIDFGKFFRFSDDYAPEAPKHFENGYRALNPALPPNWLDAAKLLDIGNMCSFLERKAHSPKSFRTARAVLRSTLNRFGY